ncbi:MAG: tyrosine-type recombinase/integrase [Nitrososphaeraceae archaeon]|nr:tyrosine-type recombinase/integrase [Nitrososphaeraceae archaeon]
MLIEQIKEGSIDAYDILGQYGVYLKSTNNISNLTLKQRVVTVKNFLEYYDVDISPRKFKLKVKLPKVVRRNKEALSKEDIVNILNTCSDIRLKTYVMLLSTTGMRAVEALSIRIKDLDLQSYPPRLYVRGEFTKTRSDRTIFLTIEGRHQLSSWIDYKYRSRRVCYSDDIGKVITEYRTPEKNDTDLIFSVYQSTKNPNPDNLYTDLCSSFAKTLDRMGRGTREEGNEKRREITFHSFRRFVKTTISDLGYQDFSEYFIGHSGSTYWTKKESEKAEIFRKIEPYLTFLNLHQLERKGADIQSKVDELEELNHSLLERDRTKDDAIAQLSDQLMTLTVRLQEIERKQQV